MRPPREAPTLAHETPAPPPHPPAPSFGLDAPVTRLPAIGPSYAQKLAKLGVYTVRDLLYLLPHRYDDFSQLRTIDKLKWGEEVTVIGTVWDLRSRTIGEERRLVTAVVGDGTGEMQMTWFNPYVERQLHTGHAYAFSGKVDTLPPRADDPQSGVRAAGPEPAQHGPAGARVSADRGHLHALAARGA